MPIDYSLIEREGLMGGRVRLVSVLSEDQWSTTFLMQDTTENQELILRAYEGSDNPKEQQEFAQSFADAWASLCQISHPLLPRYLDGFCVEGRVFLLREKVEGRSLKEIVETEERVSEDDVREYALQLCDLLNVVHARGLFLGVLRPNDVFIMPDGRVRLADYGPLPFYAQSRRAKVMREWLGGLVAPEVIRKQPLRASSDIFAIGALMHYLITKVMPRTGPSPFTLIGNYREDVSRATNRWIMRCLSFSAEGRFESLNAFQDHLLNEGALGPPPAVSPAPKGAPSSGAAAAVSAASGAALLAPSRNRVDTGLVVDPKKLEFRNLRRGRHPVQELKVFSAGSPRILIRTTAGWLRAVPDQMQAETGEIQVTVDARGLRGNYLHEAEVVLTTDRGQVSVPVQASPEPPAVARLGAVPAGLLMTVLPALAAALALGFQFLVKQQYLSYAATKPPGKAFTYPPAMMLYGQVFDIVLLVLAWLIPWICLGVFRSLDQDIRKKLWPVYLLCLLMPSLLLAVAVAIGSAPPLPRGAEVQALLSPIQLWPWVVGVNVAALFMATTHWWSIIFENRSRPLLVAIRAVLVLAVLGVFGYGILTVLV